jgi:hypothetical protein
MAEVASGLQSSHFSPDLAQQTDPLAAQEVDDIIRGFVCSLTSWPNIPDTADEAEILNASVMSRLYSQMLPYVEGWIAKICTDDMPTVRRLYENMQSARKWKLRSELGRLAREEKQEQIAPLTAEHRMSLDKWRAKFSTP